MPFCSTCGNEIAPGTRFCGSCGKEQIVSASVCPKCGKTLEENEKFCSNCGASANTTPNVEAQTRPEAKPEAKEPKLTKEGRKIIDAGPKPNQSQGKKYSPPPPNVPPQKKKRGCLGCLTVLLILSIVVIGIGAVGIFFLNKFSDSEIVEKFKEGYNSAKKEQIHTPGKFSESTPVQQKSEAIKASRSVKQIASTVEDVFEDADTTRLKAILTPNGLKACESEFKKIEPYMAEYAKAFKSRKLIRSDKSFALYSFHDGEGNEYTVEFALGEDGSWKLVRF